MGGSEEETQALISLEEARARLIEQCAYINERNWAASVTCMNRITLSKILFYSQITSLITNIPGAILELGIQWGTLTSLLYNLTSIYEPYNFRRRIVGFDTFSGFPQESISQLEAGLGWRANDLSASEDAKKIVSTCLDAHQVFSGMSHMKRHELIEGDVTLTLPEWLKANPAETIAMCIFDLDLGIPTKRALEYVLERSQKGTLLVFDEYSHPRFPGEGEAAREVLNILERKPIKSPLLPYTSYIIL